MVTWYSDNTIRISEVVALLEKEKHKKKLIKRFIKR